MTIKRNQFYMVMVFTSLLFYFSSTVMAGQFEGTWLLDDTSGQPFEATFSKDGKASGTHGDAMKYGTWKDENGVAVIHWTTGWTTRIEKKGDHYVKTAFKPGTSMTDTPTNTSSAVKK